MALVMTSGPASEPVTVAEAKAHMRIDGAAEDALIASLIVTSRLHIEAALDLALLNQSWTLILDRWPAGAEVDIPLAPLQAVNAVKVKDSAGVPSTVSPTNYLVDLASKPRALFGTRRHGRTPVFRPAASKSNSRPDLARVPQMCQRLCAMPC